MAAVAVDLPQSTVFVETSIIIEFQAVFIRGIYRGEYSPQSLTLADSVYASNNIAYRLHWRI